LGKDRDNKRRREKTISPDRGTGLRKEDKLSKSKGVQVPIREIIRKFIRGQKDDMLTTTEKRVRSKKAENVPYYP
jgi:hypothetical protein